ncbi:MAG: DUF4837 family protein [Patiriisocius sp.]|uniref:DUF4837 family protein n=1 Tax=Patiriisocius sp. TaxID=2822396 RepID=UPI003EF96053
MKTIYFAIAALVLFASCDGGSEKKYKQESLGNINTLQVIMTNALWQDSVGEEVRKRFASPAYGLPQDEPIFSMNQMPPETYTGFARKYRLFLHVTIADKDTVAIRKNPYAKPQIGAFITSTTPEGLIKLIESNYESIIKAYQSAEIKERQRRTSISMRNTDSLKNDLGIKLEIPSAYKISKAEKDFYWMQKKLKHGTTNVIVYEVPLSQIPNDSTTIGAIIKMRDSIGINKMPVEDDGQFITEEAYAPYLFESEIDGKFAWETKGTWEVKGRYMAGPFVNFAIRDEKNNRYIVIEGFTHAPSVAKRDLQFELESILRSAKID